MHGDVVSLYDAHAHRLYAHSWSLLGDDGAVGALIDTLIEAVRHPRRGEEVLWLHHVTRTVCAERGAFGAHGRPVFGQAATDPLLNMAGNLSAGHREALLLSVGKWLDVRDIADVLRIWPDGVRELLHEARTALERLVLDALMRGIADPAEHMDVIAAFEKGRLPDLLARRAPAWAPASLRDRVVAAADHEPDEIGRAPADPAASTGGLVVINSAAGAAAPGGEGASRRRAALKGVGGVTGVAATVAAGLMLTWPSAGDATTSAFGPHSGDTRPGPAPAGGDTEEPGAPDSPESPASPDTRDTSKSPDTGQKNAAPDPPPTTEERTPDAEEPARPGGGSNDPASPPEEDTPSTPSSPSSSRQQTPPPSQESPERQPDGGSRQDGPLDPITDIVGHITSPILGGLTGR